MHRAQQQRVYQVHAVIPVNPRTTPVSDTTIPIHITQLGSVMIPLLHKHISLNEATVARSVNRQLILNEYICKVYTCFGLMSSPAKSSGLGGGGGDIPKWTLVLQNK